MVRSQVARVSQRNDFYNIKCLDLSLLSQALDPEQDKAEGESHEGDTEHDAGNTANVSSLSSDLGDLNGSHVGDVSVLLGHRAHGRGTDGRGRPVREVGVEE